MTAEISDWYDARSKLITFVAEDLFGPESPTRITGKPLDRFICGILYPQESGSVNGDNPIMQPSREVSLQRGGDSLGESDAEGIREVGLSHQLRPSSIGITFALPSDAGTIPIEVHYSAIRYELISDEESDIWEGHLEGQGNPLHLEIEPRFGKSKNYRFSVGSSEHGMQVSIFQRPVSNGTIRITVSLVNTQEHRSGQGLRDALCWFRPKLEVQSPDIGFIQSGEMPDGDFLSSDVRQSNFQYRTQKQIAIGHGCAAWWPEDQIVQSIQTTFMPTHEVPLASAESAGKGEFDLNMGQIAMPKGYSELDALANSYENWIDLQDRTASNGELTSSEIEIALQNIANARESLERIRAGIALLRQGDENVVKAFQLMNLAMIRQRNAQDRARGKGNGVTGQNEYETSQRWRPFQIAFILLNLPSLVDRNHPDREIADLLWFPTGGGKTEAYLGCIAFSILYRRLCSPLDGGVSAIMRYTLRVLTTDQFMRAAGLICALESVRQTDIPDATERVSLGLWVGDSTSFNLRSKAKAELKRLIDGQSAVDSRLMQVRICPSCGSSIGIDEYSFGDSGELTISCSDTRCNFSLENGGLPLYILDEDVYQYRPSLVIGTVDKFAQMAWKSEVAQLLSLDGKFSQPDLIVQDELHLISGPLGTMVGLYESALDLALSTRGGFKTKVIASTATIRRADEQVRAVFDREARQFPAPVLSPSDNYFSKDAGKLEKGNRKYVGLLAPGISQATLLVRLYAAILQGATGCSNNPEVKDAYWTLLGYFNSLRVLGSTYLQVVDDIPARIEVLAERLNQEKRSGGELEPLELTSRVSASEILKIRERMDIPCTSPESPDVVLATNMISVGLDIDRLGLMVIAGQPQNSSEYIQASSRVGRQHPGLVFVAFNAQRSRDVSHYESFIPFHRALYRAVEATTATPFSARARDRGAHGVLVAAARMIISDLSPARGAAEISGHMSEVQEMIIKPLVDRAHRISFDDAEPLGKRLTALLEAWEEYSEANPTLEYGGMYPPSSKSNKKLVLMKPAGTEIGVDRFRVEPSWETLTSLRDVDSETELYLISPKKEAKDHD